MTRSGDAQSRRPPGGRRKRKNSSIAKSPDHKPRRRTKKQRIVAETETLTLSSSPIDTPFLAKGFRFTSHSHKQTYEVTRTFEKCEKRHKRKSGSAENHRQWAYSNRDLSNCTDKVVLVSYNILGVENALNHPDLYHNVPPQYMDWDCRKQLICKEVNDHNPSILCFQEVDRFDDLDSLLQKDGFRGIYQARTGSACDGSAIFWKNELFTLLHQENIKFQNFGLRDNVAQLCILKMIRHDSEVDISSTSSKVASQCLLVGNIHVLFNPNRGDIKLGQVRLFLQKAHKLSQEWGNIPVILAGDLNSLPQSAMYQLLASSELDIRLHDRKKISGQICPSEDPTSLSPNKNAARFYKSVSRPLTHRWSDEELRLATGVEGGTQLRLQLRLASAYAGVPGNFRTRDNNGEPLVTSYHSKFMGTVDYIWHTEELIPVRVLETLPIDILKKTRGLPSKKWGSDHLALVCELAFANTTCNT